MTKMVFVVGSPRSGTTYLSRALGLAEHTAYLGESALFCLGAARTERELYARFMRPADVFPYSRGIMTLLSKADSLRGKDRVIDAVRHLLLMSKVDSYDLNPSDTLYLKDRIQLDIQEEDELRDIASLCRLCLREKGLSGYADLYFSEYARRKQADWVIEKTPLHLRYLPVLHAIVPQARFVLIRRDKAACYASYMKTFGKGPGINRYLPGLLVRKKIWHELRMDLRREQWAMQQPWVTTVEFDALVGKPLQVLKPLAHSLGLTCDFNEMEKLFPVYQSEGLSACNR